MSVLDAFNQAVAADDAAGAEFIGMVVGEFMSDLAEVNADQISAALGVWGLDRVQVAKRALGRAYVERAVSGEYPDPDVLQQAEWIAGIEGFVSKASLYEPWRKGFVTRDEQGRFARSIDQSASTPLSVWANDDQRPAPAFTPLKNRDLLANDPNRDQKVTEQMERFQYQWEMASHFGHELKSAVKTGGQVQDGDFDFVLTVLDPVRGVRTVRLGSDKLKPSKEGGFDVKSVPSSERPDFTDSILSIEVVPSRALIGNSDASAEKKRARIAAFNTLGGAGGSKLASLAFTDDNLYAQLATSLKMDPKKVNRSFLDRLFGVFRAGGDVLSQVTGMERVGQAAQLVGVLGPQAEEVLGPYVRRAAYRYRGTETTPDPMLRRELASPQMSAVGALASGQASANDFGDGGDNLLLRDAVQWNRQGVQGDALLMKVRGDAASVNLARFVDVDPMVAELSVESGQVLPSHGIILDADGKVVSQSVGFTDDHYLPFDLMNLGRLRGGQYVRTRQQGGLTGEDIYTAVMTGARQVQVLSRSGVFTLEFAPDFRGARGNSDKAYSMYSRYLQILDAVDNSKQYVQDIDEVTRIQIANRVRAEAKTLGLKDPADVQARIEAAVDEERRRVTEPNVEGVYRQVLRDRLGNDRRFDDASLEQMQALISSLPARKQRDIQADVKDGLSEERNQKASRLQLNGQGYALALETLKQQFPYFISRVDYRKVEDLPFSPRDRVMPTRERAMDRGYALPGSLRSRNVGSGFYATGPLLPEDKQAMRNRGEGPAAGAGSDQTRPGASGSGTQGSSTSNASSSTRSAANATSGTNGAAGDGESSVVVPGAAGQQVRDSSRAKKDLERKIGDFEIEMRALSQIASPTDMLSFRQVKSSPVQLLTWMASGGDEPGAVRQAIEDPKSLQALVDAFSDEDAALRAISGATTSAWTKGFFEEDDGRPFGQDNRQDAVDEAYHAVAQIIDLGIMRDVQVPAVGEEGSDQRLFYTGALPQVQGDISAISSKDEFKAFASDQNNAPVMSLASELLRGKGDYTSSLVQVAGRVKNRIEALVSLRRARDRRAANGTADESLTDHGLSDSEATILAGPDWDDDDLNNMASEDNVRAAAALTQRAWTLVNVGRSLEYESGGELFPKKDQWELFKAAAPSPARSVTKSLRATQESSMTKSLRVTQEPVGSPLQLAVARWVSTKLG